MTSDLAAAALVYARRGIAVFPCAPRDKKPLSAHGLKDASADPIVVTRWWNRWPNANIGIPTGQRAGFWVLDLDGPEAEAGLAALVAAHGALPDTVSQGTGKGRHLCFLWDPAHEIRNSAGRLGEKIDVRGEGGYIVAPPSIHPSGRVYAWTPGASPEELAFAPAPAWLVKAAMPAEAAPAAPAAPRVSLPGRASAYGEATLSTACRIVAGAPAGRQNSSLWGYACFIGSLVAGGEIEEPYARESLIEAGLAMAPHGRPWSRKDVEGVVGRGFDKGALHPRTAERRGFQPAGRGPVSSAASPVSAARAVGEVRALWDSARGADCSAFRTWLKMRGLSAEGLPGAMAGLRAHSAAPIGRDRTGPALLAPLVGGPGEAPAALGVLPLFGGERFSHFVGDPAGLVLLLTPWPEPPSLLVAIDLQDGWYLGAQAAESGHELGVVIAPTLSAFCGGALGDQWGRVDPAAPFADPGLAPWTAAGADSVFLAVRGDLRTPELAWRKAFGGTDRGRLEGEDAARFCGGLAEQAWRAVLGPDAPVQIMRPRGRCGFNPGREAAA